MRKLLQEFFKYIISKYPSAYLDNKMLSYAEIMEINSKIEDVQEILLEREVDNAYAYF